MATRTKPTANDNPNALSTAERIRLILEENPNQTLQAVAEQVGVSRERVRQIQDANGLYRPKRYKTSPRERCAKCDKELSADSSTRARRVKRAVVCRDCRRAERITMPCVWCGADVTRPTYLARNKQAFCNRIHFGKWAGTNYGIQLRPDDLAKARKVSRRTHCKRGHPLSGDNLYTTRDGKHRQCRACSLIRARERKARQIHTDRTPEANPLSRAAVYHRGIT